MSEYGFTKKDWVLFREKIADWQEAYMDQSIPATVCRSCHTLPI